MRPPIIVAALLALVVACAPVPADLGPCAGAYDVAPSAQTQPVVPSPDYVGPRPN